MLCVQWLCELNDVPHVAQEIQTREKVSRMVTRLGMGTCRRSLHARHVRLQALRQLRPHGKACSVPLVW